MRRITIIIALTVISLTTSAAFGQTLGAVLTGSQEVPATTTPGFGNATVTFDSTRQNVAVTITVSNLGSPISAFHIHEKEAGASGSVVENLSGLGGAFTNGTMTGTFPIAADVAARMLLNPAGFYVNVHTTQFPGGAIRGQLAFVSGGPVTYVAELRGTNENPANASTAFGSAFVTFDPINNNLTWEVNTSGIAAPTASHIHRGAAGTNGSVIIAFASSATQIANGRTSGTVSIAALPAADLTALASASTASGYYVNVHSSAFPGGEVRGQLAAANEYDVAVAGRVTNGLGQTFVSDVRIFNASYTQTTAALVEYLTGGATALASTVVNLAPRATAVLDDIGGPSNLNVVGTIGALRVSSVAQLAVTSRIYADLRSTGKGTLGQFVAALPLASGLRRGVLPQLSNRADGSSGYRTNTGFFNPNTSPVTVRLELRDSAGVLLGQNVVTLGALSQQQNSIATYFPGVDLSNALNMTMSFDASAPIFAYAAVNDNVSADSSYVAALPDSGVAAN